MRLDGVDGDVGEAGDEERSGLRGQRRMDEREGDERKGDGVEEETGQGRRQVVMPWGCAPAGRSPLDGVEVEAPEFGPHRFLPKVRVYGDGDGEGAGEGDEADGDESSRGDLSREEEVK